MSMTSNNLEIAKQYLAAIELGVEPEKMAAFFSFDFVQVEFPNRLTPTGAKRDLTTILEANKRGKKVMSSQRYEIKNAVASGDLVALEVLWTGTLAVAFGSLPEGGQMRAHFAVFLEFRNGKIVAQHNYDCCEPW